MAFLFTFLFLLFTNSVYGHFNLNFPVSRGSNHATQNTSPCGGRDTVDSGNRTHINPRGFPIDTTGSHAQTTISYFLCVGENCTEANDFNISLLYEIQEYGIGEFCYPAVTIPGNYTNGTLGTIQVIETGSDGNLYNCADVVLDYGADTSSAQCANGTAVSAVPYSAVSATASATSAASTHATTTSSSTTSTTSAKSIGSLSAEFSYLLYPVILFTFLYNLVNL